MYMCKYAHFHILLNIWKLFCHGNWDRWKLSHLSTVRSECNTVQFCQWNIRALNHASIMRGQRSKAGSPFSFWAVYLHWWCRHSNINLVVMVIISLTIYLPVFRIFTQSNVRSHAMSVVWDRIHLDKSSQLFNFAGIQKVPNLMLRFEKPVVASHCSNTGSRNLYKWYQNESSRLIFCHNHWVRCCTWYRMPS